MSRASLGRPRSRSPEAPATPDYSPGSKRSDVSDTSLAKSRDWDDEEDSSEDDDVRGGFKSTRPTSEKTGDISSSSNPAKLPALLSSIGESAVMFADKRANTQFCGATSGNDKICINPDCKVSSHRKPPNVNPPWESGIYFRCGPSGSNKLKVFKQPVAPINLFESHGSLLGRTTEFKASTWSTIIKIMTETPNQELCFEKMKALTNVSPILEFTTSDQ
jgi:hypothetical protein